MGLYWRERGPTESAEFSFTRFLMPFLVGYRGWALFVDCGFLFVEDVAELARLADPRRAMLCVHHDYAPTETTKMDGVVQTAYPGKNWSSMVLFNCGHPKNRSALTPEAVSAQTGAFLHRFLWLDDANVGEVPFVWNFLVGHNRVDPADVAGTALRVIHYTSGGTSNPSRGAAPRLAMEVEKVRCKCCGFTEEHTPAYIADPWLVDAAAGA